MPSPRSAAEQADGPGTGADGPARPTRSPHRYSRARKVISVWRPGHIPAATPITVRPASIVPIYLRIRNRIVETIAARELSAGSGLPATWQVAVDLGISFHTVNKAYDLLRREGLLRIGRKSGAAAGPRRWRRLPWCAPSPWPTTRPAGLERAAAGQLRPRGAADTARLSPTAPWRLIRYGGSPSCRPFMFSACAVVHCRPRLPVLRRARESRPRP
jgi:hypothetical protein